MQGAGAATLANPVRGILDRHTLTNTIGTAQNGSILDCCTYSYFTSPVDISALVSSLTGFAVTEASAPRTGVFSDDVKELLNELAIVFFRATLADRGKGKLVRDFDHKLVESMSRSSGSWGSYPVMRATTTQTTTSLL